MFSDSHWWKSPIVTIMKTFFARRLDDKINDLIVLKTTTVPLIPAGLKGNWFRSERNHELIPNTQKICACMNFQTCKDPVLLLSTKLNKCLCGLVVAVYMLNKPKKVPFDDFTKTENKRDTVFRTRKHCIVSFQCGSHHKSGCLKLLLARGLNHCEFYSLFTDKDITNDLLYYNKITCLYLGAMLGHFFRQ